MTNEQIKRNADERAARLVELGKKVKGVIVTVECFHCNGARRFPGGPYKAQGEVIDCPICNGSGTTKEEIPTSLLYDVLMGNPR